MQFSQTFEDDYDSWPGIVNRPTIEPTQNIKSLFDVFKGTEEPPIFTSPNLKRHELGFWKQYDYDRARYSLPIL